MIRFKPEHIGLAARDPSALKDWYEHVLNAKVRFDNGEKPPAFLLTVGDAMIEIYPADASRSETSNNKLAGWRHLALKVDSIKAAQDELERRGVAFTEPIKPAGGGGRVLFFNDPEGNLLHLVERPADSLF